MSDFRLQPYRKAGDLLSSRPYVCFSHFSKADHNLGANQLTKSIRIGAKIMSFEYPNVAASEKSDPIVKLPESDEERNPEILEENCSENEEEELEANQKEGSQFFIIKREQLLLLFQKIFHVVPKLAVRSVSQPMQPISTSSLIAPFMLRHLVEEINEGYYSDSSESEQEEIVEQEAIVPAVRRRPQPAIVPVTPENSIKTERDGDLLMHEGYQFWKQDVAVKKTYWRCVKVTEEECKARVHTDNLTVPVRNVKNEIMRRAVVTMEKPSQIFNTILRGVPDAVQATLDKSATRQWYKRNVAV
uniref:FLYWCH-type domain-containing protein n=1 Tax=Ditylenchus dipsaci TaxID=166011 RepID=A0A915D6P2_9BILA